MLHVAQISSRAVSTRSPGGRFLDSAGGLRQRSSRWWYGEHVLAEAARFRSRLAALLPTYADQWVVFRDGEVVSAHTTEEAAYLAGLERFGPYGGHVVAIIRNAEVVPLSVMTAFGL